jgi:DNA-binding NarL/FixJ family response regulator
MNSAMAAGAARQLFAEANEADLAFLMRSIELGDSLTASQVARRIVGCMAAHAGPKQSTIDGQRAGKAPRSDHLEPKGLLSPRELNVLRLIAQGKTDRQIAHESQRSTHTIRAQLKSIYCKLAVKSRTQAVCEATQKGLLN